MSYPLRGSTVLVTGGAGLVGSNIVYPGLTVIQISDPWDLQQLEPFLAPLRAAGPTRPGDAAHAG